MVNETLKLRIKKLIPKSLLPYARRYLPNFVREVYRYHSKDSNDLMIREALNFFLENGPISPFPYKWALSQNPKSIQIYHDKVLNLPYVFHGKTKLHFPESMKDEDVRKCYYDLIIEQNIKSTHRYLTDDFTIEPEDIVVDCGASEGIFALNDIDKIKKLYLFEPDEKWIKPLYATYYPYINKVVIIQKYLSSKSDEQNITLDEYFKDKEYPNIIKMDVEGFEESILRGGDNVLSSERLKKVVTCVYHHEMDEAILGNILKSYGFTIKVSDGYTLLSLDINDGKLCPPYLRHGVIRCSK